MTVDEGTARRAPIRVGVVDDQELVRLGLRMVLDAQDDIEVAWEADDGADAIALAEGGEADVLLMDVRMPELDGIAATEQITARDGAPRILVLTTFDLDEYAFAALRSGASGFLLKDARPDELLGAIRAVHSGDAALAPSVTRRMIEHFMATPGADGPGADRSRADGPGSGAGARPSAGAGPAAAGPRASAGPRAADAGTGASGGMGSHRTNDAAGSRDATLGGAPDRGSAGFQGVPGTVSAPLNVLTPREQEFLVAIGEGLSNDELAERFVLAPSTVKTHIGRLLHKLGARDRVQLVILAYEHGLVGR